MFFMSSMFLHDDVYDTDRTNVVDDLNDADGDSVDDVDDVVEVPPFPLQH